MHNNQQKLIIADYSIINNDINLFNVIKLLIIGLIGTTSVLANFQ